ncbi:hypothetical protein AB0D46_31090 [Streptomyces sp. NPDC048383]|uniref:hypothetical protein n=1 Tax=Streptomyces sp. NPDC048383 TaxID=3155386 RepID=UPI0034479DEE
MSTNTSRGTSSGRSWRATRNSSGPGGRATTPRGPHGSQYAERLGATGYPPREAHELGERLAALRATLPRHAQDIDGINERKAAGLHGAAVKASEQAVYWSGHVQLTQAEEAQRREISMKFPQLHDREISARALEQQRQAAAAAEQRRQTTSTQDDQTSYTVPTPTQSGPSMRL